jgi:DNA-binding CsgD family transcriptional regulator
MPKSGRVRLSDLRRAYRLIHDCRDVGHDPGAWPELLAEGIARLVDGQLVMAGEVEPRAMHFAERGWPSPDARAYWMEHYLRGGVYRRSPIYRRYSALEKDLITRTREQVAGDAEWYRSDVFNEFYRPIGIDDVMASFARMDDPPGLLGFAIYRALGQARFGARERRLIHLFHRELGRYLGTALVCAPDGPWLRLPPRLRETLGCLLEGDSEKQAALRLGLSRHTVHQYVKDLHRRLGVNSRAELMALCLRHQIRIDPDPQ